MLVAFSVENFRSCRDVQTINMLADSGTELEENTFVPEGVAGLEGQRLLKSIAIYGPNASGKSNLVKAISFFFHFISASATERQAGSRVGIVPFLLDVESKSKPTQFKAIFVVDKVVHEYSFSVNSRRVEREELIAFPKKIGRRLFTRTVDEQGHSDWQFSRTHFHRDKELEDRTREDALFLSVAAQWNHKQLTPIYLWAREQNYLVLVEDNYRAMMRQITTEKCIKDDKFCSWATKMLGSADTGISNFRARMVDATETVPASVLERIPENIRKQMSEQPRAEVVHRIDGSDATISWGFEEESDGTRQFFALLNSWSGILHHGMTAIVDELDSSLHPLLSRKLIELVHSPLTNPKGGQVIFTTHDTSLLDSTLMRRDQVYLSHKDASGATHLYPLLDYKPRRAEALQKGYLAGRYGGVPFFGRFDVEEIQTSEKSE